MTLNFTSFYGHTLELHLSYIRPKKKTDLTYSETKGPGYVLSYDWLSFLTIHSTFLNSRFAPVVCPVHPSEEELQA